MMLFPDGHRHLSDPPPLVFTSPSISQSIAAFRQIGLEACHYHPILSLSIYNVVNYTGLFHQGGPRRWLIQNEAFHFVVFPPEAPGFMSSYVLENVLKFCNIFRSHIFTHVRGYRNQMLSELKGNYK